MRLKPHVWIIIIGCYILIQFFWWAELIDRLYQENFSLKIHLNPELTESLQQQAKIKSWMVYSETAVFALLSGLGLLFLYRSNKREQDFVRRQNNFFLSITHELKTPLAGIKLRLQTLLSRNLEPEKQKQLLNQTLENNNRLEELIEAILYTKSLDNKDIHLNKTDTNLSKSLRIFAERFIGLLPTEKKTFITFNITDLVLVPHDSTALNLILSNLLENALKYSNPKESGTIELSLEKKTHHALIKIKDKGLPIPKEENQKIFQKFYRMGAENTRTSKGTGLGLYIVKSLCKLHNIKIELESNTTGNTFTLYLQQHGK